MLLADKTVTITHLAYDGKTDTDVKTGDTVKSGSRLGSIGKVSAEASLPTHLHFEVLRGGAYQDPMATLAG